MSDSDAPDYSFIRPFDLSEPPLIRVRVTKTERNRFYMYIDIHHIISDGASLNILIKELGIFYGGNFPDYETVQYKNYVSYINKYIKSCLLYTSVTGYIDIFLRK